MRPTLGCVLLFLLLGCDDSTVEQYAAPKQERPTLATSAQPPIAAAHVDVPMTWTLPAGWTQKPEPGQMRVATFNTSDNVEIAITVFPGDVGGELANVNRWRKQLKLPEVASLDEQPLERYDVAGRLVYQLALPGMIAAGVGDGGQTWFVKMTGPPEAVAAQADHFAAFVKSLRWDTSP